MKITGEVSSDYADAAATLAFDIPGLRWSEAILGRVDLPITCSPNRGTTAIVGRVSRIAAEQLD